MLEWCCREMLHAVLGGSTDVFLPNEDKCRTVPQQPRGADCFLFLFCAHARVSLLAPSPLSSLPFYVMYSLQFTSGPASVAFLVDILVEGYPLFEMFVVSSLFQSEI